MTQIRSHHDRNDRAVNHTDPHGLTDFILREGIPVEIAVHIGLRGLRNRLQKNLAELVQILVGIVRHIHLVNAAGRVPALCLLLDDVDISDELTVLPDGEVEGGDLLAVEGLQVFNHLAVRGLIDVHISHENYSWQVIFLTEIPGLPGTDFNSVFPGDYDNRGVSDRDRLLYLSHKVGVAGSI